MGRKGTNTTTSSQPATPLVKQQPPSPFEQSGHMKSHANGNGSSTEQQDGGANGGTAYFDSGIAVPPTAATYPPSLPYADQPTAAGHGLTGPGPYDPTDNTYLYAASAAVNQAAAAATAAQNQTMAFASQVSPGVPPNANSSQAITAEDWRAQQQQPQHQQPQAAVAAAAVLMGQQQASGGNPWDDWRAAIADSQTDRYSASALLTLGTARPGDVGAAGSGASVGMGGDGSEMAMPGGVGVGVGGATVSQAGQWPLLLFNDGAPAVSGS